MKNITKCIIGITGNLLLNNGIQAQTKPNVLFIITDQQRFDAMSIAGNSILKTPNLDRLANAGARFKNAYTQCAVSGPARASILTGCTTENTGIISNDNADASRSSINMSQKTFDEILTEQAGYHCEFYGKWHSPEAAGACYKNPVKVSNSGRRIFESNGDVRFYKDNYLDQVFPKRAVMTGELLDTYTERPYIPNVMDRRYGKTQAQVDASGIAYAQPDLHGVISIPDENSLTAYRATQTMEALERLKNVPFSITCSFHFPHAPMLPSKNYFDKFPVDNNLTPASIADAMTNSGYSTGWKNDYPEYHDQAKLKFMISEYYGLIKEIDDWVGKILDKLDALGLTSNTMIVFTSDHGEMLGAHGLRDKSKFYEESAHIPLLISLPGRIPAGTVVDGYISTMDLFSTILDYTSTAAPTSDGKSLRGLINGTDQTHGKYVVTEWLEGGESRPCFMIRKGEWKMFIPFSTTSTVANVLYDLSTDPSEVINLIGSNPNRFQYFQKAEELRADLLTWLSATKSKHYNGVRDRDLMKSNTSNAVIGVTVDQANLSLGQTMTKQLTAKVWPVNATNKTVSWTSGNTNLATVSSTGLVTAISTGTTTITVTSSEGAKIATIALTITPRVAVTGVSVSPASATIAIGVTLLLNAVVSPSDANTTVSWTSNNTNVATVNSSGIVTAISTGNATITANSAYDGKTASSEITVVTAINVSGISISPATADVQTGGVQQLTATVSPSDATFKTITWSSNNTSVATVNSEGLVTGIAQGIATITGTTVSGGKIATSVINVTEAETTLDDCDVINGWFSTVIINTTDKKQGTGCLENTSSNSTEFSKVFTTPYNTGATPENGQLKFWYWVSLAELGARTVRVEISSAGKADVDEYQWTMTGLVDGWNQISLDISKASKLGNPNLAAINWFRIYSSGKTIGVNVTTRVDAIQLGTNSLSAIEKINIIEKSVNIYPNPLTKSTLLIDMVGFQDMKNVQVKIVNLLGQTVFHKNIENTGHIEINASGILKESIYFVTVETCDSKITQKLIVSN